MTSGGPSRVPVRGSIALALTAGGLALLLGFRDASTPRVEAGLGVDDADAARSPTTTVRSLASSDASATMDASSTTPRVAAESTAVGDAVSFRFGSVQVQVTVADGGIVNVQTLQMPDTDRHSLAISREVEPMLRESALAAGNADIDIISGATYTSLAYAQSLQSALDQLDA